MIKLLFLFFILSQSALISILVLPGKTIPNGKRLLQGAYLKHLYSMTSRDLMEIRVDNRIIMPWTRVSEKTKILNVIRGLDLNRNIPCIPDYHLDMISRGTNTVYLITDEEACTSQTKAAFELKKRGTTIYPIGVGRSISSRTLSQIAGPCMGICIKGFNYLHVG